MNSINIFQRTVCEFLKKKLDLIILIGGAFGGQKEDSDTPPPQN